MEVEEGYNGHQMIVKNYPKSATRIRPAFSGSGVAVSFPNRRNVAGKVNQPGVTAHY